MSIKHTPAMRQVHNDLRQRGRIPLMAPEERNAALSRVAQSRAQLAITGAPLLFKPQPPPAKAPNAPTLERRAKANGIDVIPAPWGTRESPAYRLRHPLDTHGEKFPIEIELALTKFMADSTRHLSIRVAKLDGTAPGIGPGRRLGGLGECEQGIRDSHARHQWVLDRLNADFQETAFTLLMRERQRPDGAFFSMEDFGGHLIPAVKCERTRKGISLGMLRALGCELARLYRSPLCPGNEHPKKNRSEEAITIWTAHKRLVSHG